MIILTFVYRAQYHQPKLHFSHQRPCHKAPQDRAMFRFPPSDITSPIFLTCKPLFVNAGQQLEFSGSAIYGQKTVFLVLLKRILLHNSVGYNRWKAQVLMRISYLVQVTL